MLVEQHFPPGMEKALRSFLLFIYLFGSTFLFAQVSHLPERTNSVNSIQKHSRSNSLNPKTKGKAPTLAVPPAVVINKYCNKPNGSQANEWIEFLVYTDNTNIQGWRFQDCDQTQTSPQTPATVFSNDPIWAHLRAGTVIVVWVGAGHPVQTYKKDGYIEVMATTAQYFSGGCIINLAINGDLILLRDPANVTIHELGHMSSGTPGPAYNFSPPAPPLGEPKLNFYGSLWDNYACMVSPGDTIEHYGYLSAAFQYDTKWTMQSPTPGDPFKGIPNPPNPYNGVPSPTPNSDFWRKIRQPAWTSQTLNFTYDPGNTKVTLAWTAAPDPYPADLTQGYMIVRNTVNTFGDPVDGWTYKPGDAIVGGGTVIDTVNNSQTITRIDNTPVPCNGGFFYRVYAFRYTADNVQINGYNKARGRAYNEAQYASDTALYPHPDAPTSATSAPTTYCTAGPLPGSILLEAPGGSGGTNGATGTLKWYLGGCGTENGGTLLGAGAGPNNSFTYSTPPSAPGTYTFYARWENICSNSACVQTTVTVTPIITPAFSQIGPFCQNSTAPPLPPVSLDGITGSWSPASINTTVSGTSTYTFTPDAGQCASPTTINIIISDLIAPLFTPIGPLCQNSTPPGLPPTSSNGISGTWNPATINTSAIGITTYTFTPVAGQCSGVFTMDIEIASQITPTFPTIGPFCQNSTPSSLPGTSNEGITGTWSPVTINTGTVGSSPYTFTPGAGQCGVVTTINITIALEITPTFTQIGPLCQFSVGPVLPTESINGLTGTWTPPVVATTVSGSSDYVFSPDPGQCGVAYTMSVAVSAVTKPTFAQIGPLCENSIPPAFPTTSLNLITGMWNPASISTTTIGTTMYIFTPAAGQCGVADTMNISITTEIIPTFNAISDLCQNSQPPPLPPTSLNGINGAWDPVVISTATTGASTYTFTPVGGQCSIPTTLTVNVNTGILPTINITVNQPNVCAGTTVNINSIVTNEGTTPTYQWLLDGTPVSTGGSSYSYSPVTDGKIWCKLTSSLACATNSAFSDTLIITVSPVPLVKLTDKEYLCSGPPSQLDAGPGFKTYLWQDLISTDRYYTATDPGNYWVKVTTDAGCSGVSDTVLLKVCETGISVPSGFSPNGDGVNDVFRAVATLDESSNFTLTVIDRWGEKVFETHSVFTGWDGTFNGQPSPPGVYIWRIDYQSVNSSDSKPVTLKGSVTLVR